jgi:diguanylate cyclase
MDGITELGLRHRLPVSSAEAPRPSEGPAQESDLSAFLKRLLDVMASLTPDADPADIEDLSTQIQEIRNLLAGSPHAQELRGIAAATLGTCERYLKASRQFHSAKDQEVAELIAILREAAESVLGSSSKFTAEILARTERFRALGQLGDIRDLKKRLSNEVETLQQVTEARQRQDDRALAQLSQRVEELQINLARAEEEATTDPLTKVANRRAFDRALTRAFAAARKKGQPLTLAMLDIDHFKTINDTYGHPVGDRVLLCAAQMFESGVRRDDLVARYGGEEFAVILPGGELEGAERRFVQLVRTVAERDYEYDVSDPSKKLRFTVSCGLAQWSTKDDEKALIQRADAALYEAKSKGRNRVVAKRRSRLIGLFS